MGFGGVVTPPPFSELFYASLIILNSILHWTKQKEELDNMIDSFLAISGLGSKNSNEHDKNINNVTIMLSSCDFKPMGLIYAIIG